MEKEHNPIDLIKYSTLDFDSQHQFEAISQAVSPICNLEKPHLSENGFHAEYSAFDLDGIDIIDWESDPTRSVRTNKLIKKSNLDNWAIWLVRNGCFRNEFNDRSVKAGTGELMLISYAQPWKSCWEGRNFVTVGLNRDKFDGIALSLDNANPSLLSGPLTGLLRMYILALVDEAQKISKDQKVTLSKSFSNLLAASLEPTADNLNNAKNTLNTGRFTMVQKFIHRNLDRPELNVSLICKSLGMSRRTLYSVFEEHGGVARYIKSTRLQACYRDLSDNLDHRFVSTIAYRYGFTNMSLFSRQFKEQYGFSPKDAHEHHATDNAKLNSTSPTLLNHLCKSAACIVPEFNDTS